MKEESISFGPNLNLSGTLALPAEGPRSIAFILLNAGVIHRIGPHRFNVKLARDLCAQGHACLRFDLAGLGDSRYPTAPQANFQLQAQADLTEAMNYVEASLGVRRFGIVGICSGAQHGLSAAVSDERIVGLYMIDGYAYATASTNWRRRLFQLRNSPIVTLCKWTSNALSVFRRKAPSSDDDQRIDFGQATPPREDFVRMIAGLVGRGTRIGVCYTGSWIWRYSYADQWRDAFRDEPFVDAVEVKFEPRLDHTLSTLAAQHRALGIIRGWVAKHFS